MAMGIFSKLFGDRPDRRAPWLRFAARTYSSYDLRVDCPQATRIAELAESSLKLSKKANTKNARKSYLAEARKHLDELKEMMKEYPIYPESIMNDLERRVEFFEDELGIESCDLKDSREK
ncbi:MAG: hypothetical protein HQ519_13775 [Planctomycetes bacterium]|nr:hypothetical protein [Planctomycetota bacterium]